MYVALLLLPIIICFFVLFCILCCVFSSSSYIVPPLSSNSVCAFHQDHTASSCSSPAETVLSRTQREVWKDDKMLHRLGAFGWSRFGNQARAGLRSQNKRFVRRSFLRNCQVGKQVRHAVFSAPAPRLFLGHGKHLVYWGLPMLLDPCGVLVLRLHCNFLYLSMHTPGTNL